MHKNGAAFGLVGDFQYHVWCINNMITELCMSDCSFPFRCNMCGNVSQPSAAERYKFLKLP